MTLVQCQAASVHLTKKFLRKCFGRGAWHWYHMECCNEIWYSCGFHNDCLFVPWRSFGYLRQWALDRDGGTHMRQWLRCNSLVTPEGLTVIFLSTGVRLMGSGTVRKACKQGMAVVQLSGNGVRGLSPSKFFGKGGCLRLECIGMIQTRAVIHGVW